MTKQDKHKKAARAIQEAWQQKNTQLLAAYLADKVEWYEGVIEESLTSRDSVIARWDADVLGQADIIVTIELLDFVKNRSYHRCKASWQDKRGKHQVDAIFIIHINDEGKIVYFMPWYENKEKTT